MSAVALMREGICRGSEIEHYAVYPGRPGDRSPLFQGTATDWSAAPFRTWQKQKWQSPRSFLRWARVQATSGLGMEGRRFLRGLVRRWNIDVIHTNTGIVRDGAQVAAQLGIPHVWHIRERIGNGGFMEFHMTDGDLVRFIAASSVRVAVISKYVQEIFIRHGLGKATALVYDGVDLTAFQDPKASERGRVLRERWGVPRAAILIGMVGGLKTAVKRHDLFLEMAREVIASNQEARFVIMGSIPPRAERSAATWAGRILRSASSGILKERIVFTGFEGDMPAVWSAMDIYVHLCPIEGFSRAILEAMASGTAVVTVAEGGNPEAIRDGETGLLVYEQDVERYTECVRALIDRPALREQLARQATVVAREQFSSAAHYNIMQRLFEKAASCGTPR